MQAWCGASQHRSSLGTWAKSGAEGRGGRLTILEMSTYALAHPYLPCRTSSRYIRARRQGSKPIEVASWQCADSISLKGTTRQHGGVEVQSSETGVGYTGGSSARRWGRSRDGRCSC